ncbi:MAG TPA: TorF family putative porin [Dongiaceae bacterium]|jgi:hypothetical protein|nr:TorF family putative porin [Dongiaceae bacterium]
MPRPRLSLYAVPLLVLAVTPLLVAPTGAATLPADSTTQVTQNVPTDAVSDAPRPVTDAEEDGGARALSGSANLTFASRYLFQGLDYSNGKPVLQPDMSLGYKNFTAAVWSNFDLDWQQFNEFDFTFSWSADYRILSVETGYVNLVYPNREDWDPSQEWFLDASLEAPLSPSMSWHYDFDAGTGSYLTLGLSEPILKNMTVGANLFYQDHYYGMSGIPALELNAGYSLPVQYLTCSASLSRMVTWSNGDFRDGAGPEDAWLFSFAVSRDF